MQKKKFTELGLSPELLKAIERLGFEEASPIQSQAIPTLMGGSDVVGQSQTGTGKTAAFSIPAIELVDPGLRAPQVLVLCPTRELAVQVAEEVAKLAAFKRGVRELPIYGGQSYERQFRGLSAGAQIVIGTPGRVMDHLERGTLRLEQLRMVILDEADRMLDMGFVEDIRKILAQAPPERQTVFFSATLPRPIQQLIQSFTREPVSIRIEAEALAVPAIEQIYYEVDRRSKVEVLTRLIDLHDVKYSIVFCATKMMVDELTEQLAARGYLVDKLHGDMSQMMRERVMTRFRKRAIEILVATDVAARGLDVEEIEVVFNYDLPQDGEDYVHRIGRTGRAGRAGRAITFVAGREIYKLQNIIRFTRSRIRRERVPSIEALEEKRANALFESIRETLEKGEFPRQDALIDRLLDQGHAITDIASALLHLLQLASGPAPRPIEEAAAPAPRQYPVYEPVSRPRTRERTEPNEAPADRTAGAARYRERRAPDRAPSERPRSPRPPAEDPAAGSEPYRAHRHAPTSHEAGMLRLALNVGREHKISAGDVLGVILGTTRLTKESVGSIQLQPKETLVDVSEDNANLVLKKLNGIRFKGRKLTARIAAE
jgi:ATP-dependent RNA helicase DeaD